jgi:hypothetical protein
MRRASCTHNLFSSIWIDLGYRLRIFFERRCKFLLALPTWLNYFNLKDKVNRRVHVYRYIHSLVLVHLSYALARSDWPDGWLIHTAVHVIITACIKAGKIKPI